MVWCECWFVLLMQVVRHGYWKVHFESGNGHMSGLCVSGTWALSQKWLDVILTPTGSFPFHSAGSDAPLTNCFVIKGFLGHARHICLKRVKQIRAGTAALKFKRLTTEDLCIPVIKAVQNSHDAWNCKPVKFVHCFYFIAFIKRKYYCIFLFELFAYGSNGS